MMRNFVWAIICSFAFSVAAFAKVIRYSEMSVAEMQTFFNGKSENIAEFRQGDIFQVKLDVSGDVLETTSNPPSEVKVKRGFFLKKSDQQLLMSWDGEEFKPFRELITGQLMVAPSGVGAVDSVAVKLTAHSKE